MGIPGRQGKPVTHGNRRRWISCAALGLLASACAHAPVQEIRIPIPVSCVTTLPTAPVSAFEALPQELSVFQAVQALLIDRERRAAYTQGLEAVLEACR